MFFSYHDAECHQTILTMMMKILKEKKLKGVCVFSDQWAFVFRVTSYQTNGQIFSLGEWQVDDLCVYADWDDVRAESFHFS